MTMFISSHISPYPHVILKSVGISVKYYLPFKANGLSLKIIPKGLLYYEFFFNHYGKVIGDEMRLELTYKLFLLFPLFVCKSIAKRLTL